ncbi:MAG: hypothetical protein ACRDGR_07275 [bacterium]
MTIGWQDALAFGIALVAGIWLVRRRLRQRRTGCSDCPTGEEQPAAGRLIPVSSIRDRSKPPRTGRGAAR